MENPYTKEQILRLIERKFESSKVDYKQAYPLSGRGHQCELIKDVIAMANTIDPDESLACLGFDPGYGFIIIGCDEDGNLYDVTSLDLDDANFQQIVNERVEPKINFLFVSFEHEGDGEALRFGAVIIPPSERPPHRVSKELLPFRPGHCFIRRGTSTSDKVSDAELERMFAHRALFSEAERRLQKDEFRVSAEEQNRLEHIYVHPCPKHVLFQARQVLENRHFLLIHGEMGVGKRSTALRLALDLLSERQAFRLIRVSRFTPLSDLRDAEGSAIIIPDAFGLFRLERLDIEKDVGLIEELTKSNFVIMTSSTSALAEVLRETRLEEWELMHNAQLHLTAGSYDKRARRSMLECHLSWAVEEGRVQPDQAKWLSDALESSRDSDLQTALYGLALPLDIKRLVDDRLPRIKEVNQLLPTIRELSNLQREIRTWFHSLDDDQQCFLFTLALFDGFDRSEIWKWYTQIIGKLRTRNPALSIRPLGTMSTATQPYVAKTHGTPTFAHPSFHEAILRVVAEEYREYFLDLIPDFVEASVPPADASTGDEIAKTQPVREAISLAAGEIARSGVNELMKLIEAWASYKIGRVRLAATEVLSRATESPTQIESVLKLLYGWAGDRTRENYGKRWTAAVTYGRLSKAAPERAISGLSYLATDPSPFVRSGVPKALRSLSAVRPNESRRIFTDLAADSDDYTRRAVSNVLRTVSYRRLDFVADLLKEWSSMESANRIWTLARTCFIIPRSLQDERVAILVDCIRDHSNITRNALEDALKNEDVAPNHAWSLMESLVDYDPHISSQLPLLVNVLENSFPDVSWERIDSWASHTSRELRLAAAHVLVSWKTDKPGKAQPLLNQLASDADSEIADAALMESVLMLTMSDIGEVDRPGSETGESIDAELLGSIKILDTGGRPEEDFEIRILDE